jgi:hypothetical protein
MSFLHSLYLQYAIQKRKGRAVPGDVMDTTGRGPF